MPASTGDSRVLVEGKPLRPKKVCAKSEAPYDLFVLTLRNGEAGLRRSSLSLPLLFACFPSRTLFLLLLLLVRRLRGHDVLGARLMPSSQPSLILGHRPVIIFRDAELDESNWAT